MKNTKIILIFCLLLPFIGFSQPIFFDDFNGGFKPEWTPKPNLAGTNGVVEIQNAAGWDGSDGVGMGKVNSDAGFTKNALDLKLPLQGKTNVKLTFWIYNNDDETQAEDGLWFSDNGGITFKQVYQFKPSDWCNSVYGQFPPFEVDKLAAKYGLTLNNQFVIRWMQYDNEDFSGNSDGFFLDDVDVYMQAPVYFKIKPTTPFYDDFEAADLKEAWAWRFADSTATLIADPTQPANIVGLDNGSGIDGSRSIILGKRFCDGSFLTNALDLHLDFSGLSAAEKSRAEMTFLVQNFDDETQADDGIYMSDDGGEHWKKVFDFDPGNWCNFVYGAFPPFQIGKIAAKYGLSLNDKFIIRIQQHDDEDFGGNADGLVLDNFSVYVDDVSYFPVSASPTGQFSDDFENVVLSKYWAWRFADSTATLIANPTQPANIVEIDNGSGIDGSRSIILGKRFCDGGFLTNALDLHLNFSGLSAAEKSRVEMTFLIENFDDETQADDGIYMSDDGGEHWKKVFDFDPVNWCNFVFGQFPPFQIGKIAAKYGLSLTDKFIIRIQQHDDEDFGGNADGLVLDNFSVYVDDLAYFPISASPNGQFFDDFEAGPLSQFWAWRFADSTATLQPKPTQPANIVATFNDIGLNNSFGVLLGKRFCDGNFLTNALDLHINFSGLSADEKARVEMTYVIESDDDETQADDGIYCSDDGGVNWKKVYSFDPTNWCNFQFGQTPPLQIQKMAEKNGLSLTDKFIIRFQQHDDEDFGGNADGFILDNIHVYVAPRTYAPVPFEEDFETGPQLRSMWSWSFADDPAMPSNTITSPTNIVAVTDATAENSQYSVAMGKRYCDGGFLTNALDLRLNLFDAQGVKLSFSIYDNDDEIQIQDGIWFSDNGGQTFKKIYSFDFNLMPNYVWTQLSSLDLDALVAANGLEFTDQCVLRFQQHDDEDFGGNSDGIYLDNINITAVKPTSSTNTALVNSTLHLFPNPATDQVYITWPDGNAPNSPIQWSLMDVQGNTLRQGNTLPHSGISLNGIAPGMFVLQIISEKQVWQGRLIKVADR